MQHVLIIEVESDDTDDTQALQDTVSFLDTTLPYIWNNVMVRSLARESLDRDFEGQTVVYLEGTRRENESS